VPFDRDEHGPRIHEGPQRREALGLLRIRRGLEEVLGECRHPPWCDSRDRRPQRVGSELRHRGQRSVRAVALSTHRDLWCCGWSAPRTVPEEAAASWRDGTGRVTLRLIGGGLPVPVH
jgi:hypothetical protein